MLKYLPSRVGENGNKREKVLKDQRLHSDHLTQRTLINTSVNNFKLT